MLDYWVSLNTQNTVFQPNSQVTAIVYLETDKILKARKIDISVIGIAKSAWEETHGKALLSFGDEIYYINGYAILWKSSDGQNILPPGKYQFPLTFTIPENAPTCMNGEHGSISYRIRTNIEIPLASNEERYCEFSVCPIIDLNLDRRLSQSVTTKSMKIQSSCCCCSSYPLELLVDSEVDETKTFYLTIPPLTPSYHECPIIKNDYSLFVNVFTNAIFSIGPKVLLPLTIGNIPIRESSASTSNLTIVETKNNAEKDGEEVKVSLIVAEEKKESSDV